MTTNRTQLASHPSELRLLLNLNRALLPLAGVFAYAFTVVCLVGLVQLYFTSSPLSWEQPWEVPYLVLLLGLTYVGYNLTWPWDIYFAVIEIQRKLKGSPNSSFLSYEASLLGYLRIGFLIFAVSLHLIGAVMGYLICHEVPCLFSYVVAVLLFSNITVRPILGFVKGILRRLYLLVKQIEQRISHALQRVEAVTDTQEED